ncbi:hypothetical protein HDU98_002584 [Podochytrium sp. JEL0797]|nr:hypothetical protein HDU98_002584 [Podochytrium sp. JEL0797]
MSFLKNLLNRTPSSKSIKAKASAPTPAAAAAASPSSPTVTTSSPAQEPIESPSPVLTVTTPSLFSQETTVTIEFLPIPMLPEGCKSKKTSTASMGTTKRLNRPSAEFGPTAAAALDHAQQASCVQIPEAPRRSFTVDPRVSSPEMARRASSVRSGRSSGRGSLSVSRLVL